MTEDPDRSAPIREATLRTTHDDPAVVAAAIGPDNTAAMETTATDDGVRTTIERPTTGGLQSTVDDYLVNLQVADDVAGAAGEGSEIRRQATETAATESHRQTTDTGDDTTTDT